MTARYELGNVKIFLKSIPVILIKLFWDFKRGKLTFDYSD